MSWLGLHAEPEIGHGRVLTLDHLMLASVASAVWNISGPTFTASAIFGVRPRATAFSPQVSCSLKNLAKASSARLWQARRCKLHCSLSCFGNCVPNSFLI